MPKLFLSYNSADVRTATALEQQLGAAAQVWRDQKDVRAGEKWPRRLGEAIDECDAVVLLWSQHSAGSEFVELEWNIALCLKKPILPCRLDATPLPAALKPLQAISVSDIQVAAARIIAAVGDSAAGKHDRARSARVLDNLGTLSGGPPAEVLQAARAIFEQQGWVVHGTLYQAARDIHVSVVQPPQPASPLAGRWQLWAGLLVGIAAAIGLVRAFMPPASAPVPQPPAEANAPAAREFEVAGFAKDEHNRPVHGATVSIPEFGQVGETDRDGYFRFRVQAPEQKTVVLTARWQDQCYDGYVTLGNSNMGLTLDRRCQ